jgi:hypothetical protein
VHVGRNLRSSNRRQRLGRAHSRPPRHEFRPGPALPRSSPVGSRSGPTSLGRQGTSAGAPSHRHRQPTRAAPPLCALTMAARNTLCAPPDCSPPPWARPEPPHRRAATTPPPHTPAGVQEVAAATPLLPAPRIVPPINRRSPCYHRRVRRKKTPPPPTLTGLCPAAPSGGDKGREARLGGLTSGGANGAPGRSRERRRRLGFFFLWPLPTNYCQHKNC